MLISPLVKPVSVKKTFYQDWIERNLANADILINGSRSWDIQIHDDRLYPFLFKKGSLALGESYMYGFWDCEQLDELMFRILKADLEQVAAKDLRALSYLMKSRLFNEQSVKKSYGSIEKHYDLGNDLFEAMLDKRMNYSCAYWANAETLEEAQENKLDLICRKLMLQPGEKVLDIGCGWGGFLKFAAEKYQIEGIGITISKEQLKLARQHCSGLPIEIRLQDYRSVNETFDKVVSIGMFEHVGYKNYSRYMDVVQRILKKDGLFLLHTIGGNITKTSLDPWINTYIFPNAVIPSIAQIGKAIENKFIMEDWHNFGLNYDRTLMEWLKRFRNSWDVLKFKYNEHFYRMWEYYLASSAASFRAKKNQLWQIVLSPPSNFQTYVPVR